MTQTRRYWIVGFVLLLVIAATWLRALPADGVPAPDLVLAAGVLLALATKDDAEVRTVALALCDCLMTLPGADAVREPARDLVRTCLKSDSVEVRLRAIQTS